MGWWNIQNSCKPDYPRLRLGSASRATDAADYVLSRFKPAERTGIQEAIALGSQAVLTWVRKGIDVCMNQANGEPKAERPKKEKPKKEKPEKGSVADAPTTEPGPEKPRD